MQLNQRFDRLLDRRIPAEDRRVQFSGRYATRIDGILDETDEFLAKTMAPIDAKYTQRLYDQGSRIENQLNHRLRDTYPYMEFRRQGSVSNDTHIRHSSDVDVLVFPGRFEALQMPQPNPSPYKGNPEDTLLLFRQEARDELDSAFWGADVDDSGSTAIKLSGGSLACSVDVVPSSWYNTIAYAASNSEPERGVEVLNKEIHKRVLNFPFRFNHRLDFNDRVRSGATRRMIRLLKTLKVDLVEEKNVSVAMSSYDICSLIFRMEGHFLNADGRGARMEATGCLRWITQVVSDFATCQALQVVDDSRLIFDSEEKVEGLHLLQRELSDLMVAQGTRTSLPRTSAAW